MRMPPLTLVLANRMPVLSSCEFGPIRSTGCPHTQCAHQTGQVRRHCRIRSRRKVYPVQPLCCRPAQTLLHLSGPLRRHHSCQGGQSNGHHVQSRLYRFQLRFRHHRLHRHPRCRDLQRHACRCQSPLGGRPPSAGSVRHLPRWGGCHSGRFGNCRPSKTPGPHFSVSLLEGRSRSACADPSWSPYAVATCPSCHGRQPVPPSHPTHARDVPPDCIQGP